MTIETLRLLQRLLCGQQLTVGAPDFPETALAVIRALGEIEEAVQRAEDAVAADDET